MAESFLILFAGFLLCTLVLGILCLIFIVFSQLLRRFQRSRFYPRALLKADRRLLERREVERERRRDEMDGYLDVDRGGDLHW